MSVAALLKKSEKPPVVISVENRDSFTTLVREAMSGESGSAAHAATALFTMYVEETDPRSPIAIRPAHMKSVKKVVEACVATGQADRNTLETALGITLEAEPALTPCATETQSTTGPLHHLQDVAVHAAQVVLHPLGHAA